MDIILNGILSLAILMLINIALGLYNNIGKQGMGFDWKILLIGIIKAFIIGSAFVGLAWVFSVTDLSAVGVTPDLVLNSALILYATKAIQNLMDILGVKIQ